MTLPNTATPPRVPDQPGLWWRDDCQRPVFVRPDSLPLMEWTELSSLTYHNPDWQLVRADGHWLCPCPTPGEQVARLAELRGQCLAMGSGNSDFNHEAYGIEAAATALGLTLPAEGGR